MNPGKHLKVNTTLKILYQNMNSQNKAHIKTRTKVVRKNVSQGCNQVRQTYTKIA